MIATGEMHTVREFVEVAFGLVGLDWEAHVRIDERYFRPTEVDELCGDASKAERVLGWQPRTDVPRARPAHARGRPARGRARPGRAIVAAPRPPHDRALAGRRVMVTGGGGFLGRAVVARLEAAGADDVFVPRSADYDLRTRDGVDARARRRPARTSSSTSPPSSAASAPTARTRAASSTRTRSWASSSWSRRAWPASTKFVQIGTVCSYPKFTPVPFREDDLWNGYPEETNAPVRPGQEDAARPGPGVPRSSTASTSST